MQNTVLFSFLTSLVLFAIPTHILAYFPDKSCCDSTWYLQNELLFWTAHEGGLEYTTHKTNILDHDNFTKKNLIHPDFHWDYGFRLTGGYSPACSPWDYSISWANISLKATGVKRAKPGEPDFEGIFPVWSMSPDTLKGDYVARAKSKWILHTNIIDMTVRRTFCFFHRLQLNPILGLRCAILNQKLHAKYSGGTFFNGTDDNIARNRFVGVGPRFGADGSYHLFKRISLHGLFAATPFYGHFKTSHKEHYLRVNRFEQSNEFNRLNWCLDYDIGLQWEGKTLDCWPDVLLALSWEGHTFFNQNRMHRGDHGFFHRNRNLTLKGWTFLATFSF